MSSASDSTLRTSLNNYPRFPDGAKLIGDLGLQQLGPFPKGSGLPGFEFDGASGLTSVSGAREEALREHKYQFADNLTWIHGRHTMKFGFDVRELRLEDYENFIGSDNFGNYYFNGNFTGYDNRLMNNTLASARAARTLARKKVFFAKMQQLYQGFLESAALAPIEFERRYGKPG